MSLLSGDIHAAKFLSGPEIDLNSPSAIKITAGYKHGRASTHPMERLECRRREVHVTAVGRLVLAVLLFLSTTILLAQDRHLSDDPAHALYAESAFAHGYIHGYQEGFHHGDLDLQLGRAARDPSSLPGFRHWTDGFQRTFGSRDLFKQGFRDGVRAGYSDAINQYPFGAIASLRQAAAGVTFGKQANNHFDTGFHDGYDHGRRKGAEDGRSAAANDPIEPPCLGLPAPYCSGYHRGFLIGYGDGFRNQSAARVQKLQASAAE